MTTPAPVSTPTDWKRTLRLASLGAGGAIGVMGTLLSWPRWIAATAMVAALVIWFGAGADRAKTGETEAHRRQRTRNLAIGLALGALVVLFYVATMARLGGNALNRPY